MFLVAYAVIDVEIHDIGKYMEFMEAFRPVLEAAGGRYLARGGDYRVYEGDYQPRRLVVLEFPSLADLDRFYASEAHQQVKKLRDTCSESRIIAVEGLREED